MRRQYYNYSSSELFQFFHLPFIFPPGSGHMVYCLCVCDFWGVLVCAHTWEAASIAQKIPLRGICIGLLCYSRLSGTLVPTYLSMSEQAVENKLICFSFYPPSSLSSPSFTCFLPYLSLHINLCLTRPLLSISSLFSSLCYYKMQHFPSSSFRPSLHAMKVWVDELSVYVFWSWIPVSVVLNVMLSIPEL